MGWYLGTVTTLLLPLIYFYDFVDRHCYIVVVCPK